MVAVESKESGAGLASLLEENREGLLTCVHCGLCLPSCPTYRELGNENDSPRGRIYLMRALVEGRIAPAETFTSHIDLCLGCRACEPVCPSGVPYGQLLEAARVKAAEIEKSRGSVVARLTALVLNQVFTRPSLLRIGFWAVRLFRDSGMAQLIFESDMLKGRLRFAIAMLLASRPFSSTRLSSRSSVRPESPRAGLTVPGAVATGSQAVPGALATGSQEKKEERVESGDPEVRRSGARGTLEACAPRTSVAVLRGCVMEGLFSGTNHATERVLSKNGCTLVDVEGQGCCGALHAHAGQIDTAKNLARRNIDAFLSSDADKIIVNAAGCGAAMKEYRHLLKHDSEYAGRARDFSSKVRDVAEFLAEGFVEPQYSLGEKLKVAYDAPCHVIHAQRIVDQPVKVLKSIPGLELAPLQGYETCCGGAGIYNLLNPELSGQILAKKIESIRRCGAEVVVTSNPGCLLQIGAGLLIDGAKAQVVQLVDLLDAAYSGRGDSVG